MATPYARINQSGRTTTYVTEFVVDNKADINELPVAPEVATGSDALVLADSSVFMLGNDNEWHEI